ncbi:hypothetical protein PCANC_03472 [Puccinia coronata f. sp. avenae]|uniref:Uncharacterized protein n=1 Tax=Puccinia coronata f. sp. avenae TaxID=200324 RepID=A0A2N5W2E1_9BASI|nr:hypothetical protein PCASD_02192 [Puccinia coronata f. sp. avenae]PLW56418.1 hypothetical protein PCANC_03472 [Puccinia coronata f. sp. avenae]
MHHRLLTAALLIFSSTLVQAQSLLNTLAPHDSNPAPTPATPSNPFPSNPAPPSIPGTTPQSLPPLLPGTTLCENKFFSFSERELAERFQKLHPGNRHNPDPQHLSSIPSFSLCLNSNVTAVCELNSCAATTETIPECTDCREYNLGTNGQEDTVGTVVIPQITCEDNYIFNATETKTPYTCSNKLKQIFTCNSCQKVRACNTCYDAFKLPYGV